MSSPLVRGQSKTSNSGSSLHVDRINGTMNSSSSYDNMRPLAGSADSDIDGLQVSSISSTQNGLSKADFRYIALHGISLSHTKPSFSTRSDYPPITKIEQRRRYKTEFDKDYSEYRQLHKIMEKARNRFANLQDELRKVHPSDERKYKVSKVLIVSSLSGEQI